MSILVPRASGSRSGRADTSAPGGPPRPQVVAGLVAAGHAAATGLLTVTVVVLLGWATAADSGASAGQALRSAVQVWLVGQGTALAVPGGRFSLAPLGLSALPAVLLYLAAARAARSAAVDTPRGAVSLTAVLAGSYAVLNALLALAARTPDVRPLPVSAFVAGAVLALLAGGAGAVRAAGVWPALWQRLPAPAAVAVTGGLTAVATLVCGGALLAAGSLAARHGTATVLIRGVDPGLLGGLLLFVACLLYLPTTVVWAASYAAGPGFALGAGTAVTPWGTQLGSTPAFPLLAGLPGDGGPAACLVLAVPLAAGILAGLVAERRDRSRTIRAGGDWRRTLLLGAGVGGVAGVVFAVLTAAAAGAAGPGRLGQAGPPWWCGIVVALEIGLVAAATLLVRRRELPGRSG